MGWLQRRRPSVSGLLVPAGLVAYVGLVYLALVVGAGALIGRTDSPSPVLSIIATAIVAVTFEPVRGRLRGWASQALPGSVPSPYETQLRFTADSLSALAAAEVPARMARILAEGTRAAAAEVWIYVGDRLTRAAVWPPEHGSAQHVPDPTGVSPPAAGQQMRSVRHGEDLLGALIVKERDGEALTPIEQKLLDGLAAQAGLVLRNLQLTAELQERLVQATERGRLLRESRERVVELEDEERRRLERDIHDGAQQQLVSLAVQLRLAHALIGTDAVQARMVLHATSAMAQHTAAGLADVAHSISPTVLQEAGLPAALRAAADTSPLEVEIASTGSERYPAPVETAVYFFCLEALQNVAKHASATRAIIHLEVTGGTLCCQVTDDGCGFDTAEADRGRGVAGMAERVHSVGGRMTLTSVIGSGTTVTAAVPVKTAAHST